MRARHSAVAYSIVCSLVVADFRGVASAQSAPAAPEDIAIAADVPLETLERALWACDHTATTHGVDATPVAACTAVFEALKDAKFGGDFTELLSWWRRNKLTEHTRLESR